MYPFQKEKLRKKVSVRGGEKTQGRTTRRRVARGARIGDRDGARGRSDLIRKHRSAGEKGEKKEAKMIESKQKTKDHRSARTSKGKKKQAKNRFENLSNRTWPGVHRRPEGEGKRIAEEKIYGEKTKNGDTHGTRSRQKKKPSCKTREGTR